MSFKESSLDILSILQFRSIKVCDMPREVIFLVVCCCISPLLKNLISEIEYLPGDPVSGKPAKLCPSRYFFQICCNAWAISCIVVSRGMLTSVWSPVAIFDPPYFCMQKEPVRNPYKFRLLCINNIQTAVFRVNLKYNVIGLCDQCICCLLNCCSLILCGLSCSVSRTSRSISRCGCQLNTL